MSNVDWSDYDAVLFDLDGVITDTAGVHAAAWKAAFDDFLDGLPDEHDPFDIESDYRAHVDGRPRYDGVAAFLESRSITLPRGLPSDRPGHDTICAVGNLKNDAFGRVLAERGADVFEGSLDLLDHLDVIGMPYAVVSASKNAGPILESVGHLPRFRAIVDGLVAAELGLLGKPEPDPFLEGARRLGVDPQRAVVVEDAVSGVQAGRAGGFGLVIGVDRHDDPDALAAAGAHVVVEDLAALVPSGWPDFALGDDPWVLVRSGLPEDPGMDETLFALANGNLGIRGALSQGAPRHEPGALLNGFHETWPIKYPEHAYGFPTMGQTIVYLPDATHLSLAWNGEVLDLTAARVTRSLQLRTGVVTTEAVWDEVTAVWRRIVPLGEPAVLAMDLTITAALPGTVEVRHEVVNVQDLEHTTTEEEDPRRARGFGRRVLVPTGQAVDGPVVGLGYRTQRSGLPLAVVSRVGGSLDPGPWDVGDDAAAIVMSGEARPGESHRVEVTVRYDRADLTVDSMSEVGGFAELAARQVDDFASLWSTSEITIDGDDASQRVVNFALFQLHQASAAVDGTGIPAKGLTGQAYEGHHFWDSDVFVGPFLSATNPRAAEAVIRWRHSLLPKARQRAEEMSLEGVLFPWRTITGEEASAFFEAGTAQFHVAADVVYGLRNHVAMTGDQALLVDCGAEIVTGVARMFASLGFWRGESFHIHGVTGPDEYTALVNDNAYTNQMARMALRFAADTVDGLRDDRPDAYDEFAEMMSLDIAEVGEWRRMADAMTVIVDDELAVTAQDATFLSLEPWDWSTPREKYPLLLNFHPLVIYKHQMLKQADVVMAHFLLPEDTPFDRKVADFDFYDPLTTGDSSLSPAIQSAVASRLGRPNLAWEYFKQAAAIDLANLAGNTADGIHLAAAAGVWLAIVKGFAGFELGTGGTVHTDPRLPTSWRSLTIRMQVRGEPVELSLGGS